LRDLLSPAELLSRVGQKVTIAGWVHDVRMLGGISFVVVRNSKGMVQVAAPKKTVSKDVMDTISSLHQEDVVECTGLVKESKVARLGFEIIPEQVLVVNRSEVPLPLDPRGVTPAAFDTRLAWRILDLRRPESLAVFAEYGYARPGASAESSQ